MNVNDPSANQYSLLHLLKSADDGGGGLSHLPMHAFIIIIIIIIEHNRTNIMPKRQNGKSARREKENSQNGRDDHAKVRAHLQRLYARLLGRDGVAALEVHRRDVGRAVLAREGRCVVLLSYV